MAGPLDAYVGDVGYDPGLVPAPRPVEQTGFFDNIVAGYRAARAGPASTALHQNAFEAPYYDQVIAALNARGETTTDALQQGFEGFRSSPRAYRNPLTGRMPLTQDNPYAWQQTEATNIWSAVARIRQSDPSFLKDLPDNQALIAKAISDRRGQLADAEQVTDRASTLGKIGGFLGSLGAAPFEPETYVGGFGGGGAAGKLAAKTVVRSALSSSAQNVIGALVGTPGQQADAADLGIDMTTGDVLHNVGTQAVAGALLGGAHATAPHVIAAGGKIATKVVDASLDHLPEPMKTAAIAASIRAGTVGDRASTIEARRMLDPYGQVDISTPDEKAALQVSDRDADVREASPLHPDPVAAGAHDSRLAAMEQWLGVANEPADVPTPAPLPVAPPGGDLTTAINRAEGTGKNPNSSAEGVGQFLKSTWLDVYKRNFGGDGMSDAQILALRHDPTVGAQMTAIYGRENAAGLRRAGLEDSPGNVSLAHFLGLAGARDVLKAAPDTPIEGLLPEKVIAANEKVLRGKSAGDVIEWAHKRIGNASGAPVARGDAVAQWDPVTDALPDDAPPIHVADLEAGDLDAGELPLSAYLPRTEHPELHQRLEDAVDRHARAQAEVSRAEDAISSRTLADSIDLIDPDTANVARSYEADLSRPDATAAQRATAERQLESMRQSIGADALDKAENDFQIGLKKRVSTARATLKAERRALAFAQRDFDTQATIQRAKVLPPAEASAPIAPAADAEPLYPGGYDPVQAGTITVWQGANGQHVVVDGIKRVARARAIGHGPVTAQILRETDGVTLDQAREIGRLKSAAARAPELQAMREAAALSNQQFGDLLNGRESGGDVSGAAGRALGAAQADSELADRRGVSGGTTPYADAIVAQRVGERFSDPVEGSGAASQVQSLEHDLQMHPPEGTFRMFEDGAEQSIAGLLKDAESDLSAVEKARACMAPPKLDTAA